MGGGPLVLVVDDEAPIRGSLRERLEWEGFSVVEAATGAEARARFGAGADAVILDYMLPDVDGFALLVELHRADPAIPIVMLTAHASVEHAVQAMRSGAFHYARKPFDLEDVVHTVRRATEGQVLRQPRAAIAGSIDAIIGESEAMQKVKHLVARIARTPSSTVLLTGESGTGKDLTARAIHAASDRADRPFLNITCSALPATLLESELFGHERGAFTDARTRKKGLLEHADSGSVFLDEIGEMEIALQAKLLRFLEDKGFRRVGGNDDLSTDVRIIAATNVDLREAVRQGRFREDLYYRLAVLTVHLPPLRERDSDVELLAAQLIDHFNRQFGKSVRNLSREALTLVRSYPWPGNVRELRNAIERAILLSDKDTLTVEDFGFLGDTAVDQPVYRLPAAGVDMRDLERELLVQALDRCDWNQTRAAELLGMNRDQVRYRIATYGLKPKQR